LSVSVWRNTNGSVWHW